MTCAKPCMRLMRATRKFPSDRASSWLQREIRGRMQYYRRIYRKNSYGNRENRYRSIILEIIEPLKNLKKNREKERDRERSLPDLSYWKSREPDVSASLLVPFLQRPWRDSEENQRVSPDIGCVSGASARKSDSSGCRGRRTRFAVISFYLLFLFGFARRMTRMSATELAKRKREKEEGLLGLTVAEGSDAAGRNRSMSRLHGRTRIESTIRRRETRRKRSGGREAAVAATAAEKEDLLALAGCSPEGIRCISRLHLVGENI